MSRILGVGCIFVLAGCGAAAGDEQARQSSAALLSRTPNLSTGQVCSTRGFAGSAPTLSAGVASFAHPQSRGVLGGTGVGPSGTIAQTRVDFTPTLLSNSIAHGPSQRVCAEVGARSACDAVYACWYGDGRYTIESNTAQRCDPTAEHATTVLQTGTALLPGLAVGNALAIELSVDRSANDTISARFYNEGALLQSLSSATHVDRDASRQGLSGFRADRVALTASVKGSAPFSSPSVSGVWLTGSSIQGVATRAIPTAEALHCSYLAPPPTDLSTQLYDNQPDTTMRPIGVTWQPPDGAESALTYAGFLDGRPINSGLLTLNIDWFFSSNSRSTSVVRGVVDSNYSYQIAYQDGALLSEMAPRITRTQAAPITPLADGNLSIGVVLLAYADGPTLPYTREQIAAKIFGDTGYTLKNYLKDVSRNHVLITGDVSQWITVKRLSGASAGQPIPFTTDCPGVVTDPNNLLYGYASNCNYDAGTPPGVVNGGNRSAQAAAGGFPVTGYERVIYLTNGVSSAFSQAGYVSMGAKTPYTSDPDGLTSLSTLLHEFGHALSFEHTYTAVCPRGDRDTFLDDLCTLPGGSRASNGTPKIFDPMAQGGVPAYRYNTEEQRILGWVLPAEQAVHLTGQTNQDYVLAPMGASTGLRQLRLETEANAFYFAEYRTKEGFDASDPFPPRDINGDGVLDADVYQDPTGVAVWLSGGTTEQGNYNRIHSVASNLGAGDLFCDPYRKVAIRVTSTAGGNAAVRVERGAVPCQLSPLAAACALNDECESTLCSSGLCWTPGATPPYSTPQFGSCSQNADCGTHFCSNGVCLTPVGGQCTQNNQCSTNRCESNVCLNPALPVGSACSANNQCTTNRCVSSVCTKLGSLVTSIDTSDGFTCAVLDDASVRCWGQNDRGQLGVTTAGSIGDQPGEMTSLQPIVLSGPARRVFTGRAHACALLTNGSVQCWGDNTFGQLGVGDTATHAGAVTPDLDGPVTALALGDDFACFLRNSQARCWGTNNHGQLGIGTTQAIGDGPGEMGAALQAVALPIVSTIATGESHACVIALGSGFAPEVRCWGENGTGQLGINVSGRFGDSASELTPLVTELGTGFAPKQIALGQNHTCALSEAGQVKCWGWSEFGECGYGDTADRGRFPSTMGDNLPVVPLGFSVTAIDAHRGETCVMSTGGMKCWGMGSYALGQPALANWDSIGDQPGEIANLPLISLNGTARSGSLFTTSGAHTCTTLKGGYLNCWGQNQNGQLGLGDTAMRGDDVSDMGSSLPYVFP